MSEWIKHTGLSCPVPEDILVDIEVVGKQKNSGPAKYFTWNFDAAAPNAINLFRIQCMSRQKGWTMYAALEGNKAPVAEETLVQVYLGGTKFHTGKAGDFYWQECSLPIQAYREVEEDSGITLCTGTNKPTPMHELYPAYYRDVSKLDSIDTYAINRLFPVVDPTGCVLHSRKKLLLAGSRTGGKEFKKDIKEARDTLTRLIELWEEDSQT